MWRLDVASDVVDRGDKAEKSRDLFVGVFGILRGDSMRFPIHSYFFVNGDRMVYLRQYDSNYSHNLLETQPQRFERWVGRKHQHSAEDLWKAMKPK